ncbi:sodium/potassium-transporting ATPase subunit beta-3a [Denticeps clupeoides]|uniref:Sodium/potassium-transporting ATPase subunit beta n=1 Tax=Denticeps clupeoides TaxID=299321 RepID=A0AAY4ADA9_9TELE|nr:sodium/potassium-transporting ATPase subunit beta-3 [Denticeps clupeoides]
MSTPEDKTGEEKVPRPSWRDVIYNPRTGEFVGRTASSWGLIFLFYLAFYGFLAGMFALTMWVMLQTLDENTPRYRDRIANPGLVIRSTSMDIFFNRSDPLTYRAYVQHLESFLQQYNNSVQGKNEQCVTGQYFDQDEEVLKKACQFRRSTLNPCSGEGDRTFGYFKGQPCILVKMNRVIGLKPRGEPYINCTAKAGNPLKMHYYPSEGRIDKMYFPYYGKKSHQSYVQPLVAVKLLITKEDYNKEISIECRVEGSNLQNNDERDKFQGRVNFRVKVME